MIKVKCPDLQNADLGIFAFLIGYFRSAPALPKYMSSQTAEASEAAACIFVPYGV